MLYILRYAAIQTTRNFFKKFMHHSVACPMIHFQISHDTKILFVGINPHHGSYRRGVPFSNNKMFWYLLSDAGLIDESREELKDDTKLKEVYLTKFTKLYHYGLINMIDRPSRNTADLKQGEELFGRARLLDTIDEYKPQIVCFVGKITYQKFIGLRSCNHGWQPDIKSSKIYVMHTPLRGLAAIRIEELKELKAR